MAEHTPGPWTAKQKEGHPWQVASPEGTVAYVFGTAMKGTKVQQEANAHLIEAGPDLLEVLEELVDIVNGWIEGDDYRPDSFTLQPARLAIAKAKGRK